MIKRILKQLKNLAFSPFILKDFKKFQSLDTTPRFSLSTKDFYPQIFDNTLKTGFDRHYVYHTSWAARVVKEINPKIHVDIASSLYFCGIVSAFIPIKFYDYRPAELGLNNLTSDHADLTSLDFESNSIESLSCMHTIEHIGLGRYGDPIDPEGDLKAIKELKRVTAPGGSLLFVTPIGGKAFIEFNAHRIYTYDQIMSYFEDEFELKEFSLIPEHTHQGDLIRNATKEQANKERYGAGCFWFIKRKLL